MQRTKAPNDPSGGLLCFPGGRREKGEDGRTAAERETKEEVGLDLARDGLFLGHMGREFVYRERYRVQCFLYLLKGHRALTPCPD
jgi:8-oxo-dGTP pyrophosphatase MutT (NUDIX family)